MKADRLAAELGNGAPAFLALVNVQHVFKRERLKVELVAGVVVGGDRFRVRVDHEGLEAVLLEGKGRMHAAIVKLDALADAVRTAAQNHDLLAVAGLHLVVAAVVGRVVVWRVSLELRGAGIHEAEARHQAELLALGADSVLRLAGQMGDLPVGESKRLGLGQLFCVHRQFRMAEVSRDEAALSSADLPGDCSRARSKVRLRPAPC